MPNNIAVSITADVADLTAKLAIANANLKATQKSLNDLAGANTAIGMTPELLKAGDAAAKARNEVLQLRGQLTSLRGAGAALPALAADAQKVTAAMSGLSHGSAGVTRELLVMAREAARGNFSRLAGSATILAGRFGVLTPEVLLSAGAFAAIIGPLVAFLVAAEQGSEQLAKFQNAMAATNDYAGVTFSQLQVMAKGLASWANEGVGAATAELMKLAASGNFTGQSLALIGADATRMGQLTGEGADKFNQEFEKMGDGVAKFAADYQAKYHQLTTAQFAYILQLEQQGKTEQAEYQLAKDVYDYLGNQAPQHLGTLESAWNKLAKAAGDYWAGVQQQARIADNSASPQDKIEVAQREIARIKAGAMSPALGDQGAMNAELAAAQARLKAAEAEKAAEDKRNAPRAADSAKQTEGVAAIKDLGEQFEASKTSGEKLRQTIAQINDELAKAKAADPGNAALYEKEAAAARAQAQKSDAPPKAKSDQGGQVEQWEAELQKQTITLKNFYGDQTEAELAFWQSKIAATTVGSKEWLAVQTKVYDAQKTLARQAYADQVATLNEQLAADRDNWAKEQSDLAAKLAYIKSTQGAESAAYKEAQKEQEQAEREHQRTMAEVARTSEKQQLDELKANLATDKSIREANARTQESQITEKGKSTPGGEITAAVQIAALHRQMSQAEMADDAAVYAQESALAAKAIAEAQASYTTDSAQYAQAVAAKKKLDDDYYNHKRQLENQATNQQIADQQRIQQSWHSYVDPMVSTTGAQIKGLISGTESWNQALVNIGEGALNLVIQAIEKMVAQWIVAQFTGAAQQKTMALTQVASYAGIAGAAGVASMAGAPFPLDLSAPAFGASMEAAALTYGSIGGFAQGIDVVPNDMIAQIHAGERIMPAADNSQLMNVLSGVAPAAGGRGGGAAGLDPRALRALGGQLGVNTSALRGVTRQARRAMGAMAR